MIIKLKKGATNDQVSHIVEVFESLGMEIKDISGKEYGVLGIVGDTSKLSIRDMEALEGVEKVTRIQEPFKKANRKMQEECTIIDVNGIKIGRGNFTIMSGPCSVESRDQILEVARSVKASGAQILRGGAYKPRTSPYAFQGMELEGLELLKEAKKETGMPIVTEIMSVDLVEKFAEEVDIIQVGARNMQNFDLLKALGKIDKPILLKRGLSATIEEWLMSAEYIMAGGNDKVILCERGIRTYEKYTRNTLDLSAVLAVKKLSHLPVIVDPSHATGKRWMVKKLAMAAAAVGADGLMIEVHNDPENALCDGAQSLRPEQFEDLVIDVKKILEVVGKKM
ncbi:MULTISPECIES: 3-deoxy-7-phosphoheptulonate synthase [Psychrilyobacter]|uniref:3-deoxy-7-phosphoheptulonate synthase n=1 Tax=Psychrilyobacter piezotolerans TaxID=2293438 RepID=A0ABX9KL16_9FUSO|nr:MULTISPECIES: 3-deoxy-7-phosphoheptulonate synthase [Psychrilyobacter]MCS5420997.1 3-deoxy-7-phosphoheptulonate synthase [Psychrilyobacter sp. S5]NDI76719.1 3-deoxy-7-phosphoheptulonate synthase [Psychrilyobacter piezotolerans]RDE65340.1 3-deoxy-7-phosphoheptulonate synthase [Psychrilyobacter sp. S5]REI42958.1 3-deoxy-7-phosphoheptulonate synthase [Psychrilyobacter piezotolerans]